MSNEGVWAMAEEGVGAGVAWRDEPKHRSGGRPRGAGGKEGRRRAGVPWKLFGGALGRPEKK